MHSGIYLITHKAIQSICKILGLGVWGGGIVGGVRSEEVLQSTCKDPACLSCKRDEVRTRSKGSHVIELV